MQGSIYWNYQLMSFDGKILKGVKKKGGNLKKGRGKGGGINIVLDQNIDP
jgi:hypothetical protein